MRLNLPSGGWADIRDKLKPKDRFAVHGAVRVTVGNDGDIDVSAGIQDLMRVALISRLLEAWSLDAPLPGQHSCPGCTGNSALWHQHVIDYIDDVVGFDDWDAIEAATEPLLERVNGSRPNPGTSSGSVASS